MTNGWRPGGEKVATYPRNPRTLRNDPLPPKGGARFRGLSGDARKLASEAYALWRELAVKLANPYSDHTAGLLAGRMAVDAMLWEDGLVILAAIKARMDEKSSPRRIPEWARLQGADQRYKQHKALKDAEKAERDVIIEHEGTLFIGHRPEVVGSACVKCGGDFKSHKLARRPALRHILGSMP